MLNRTSASFVLVLATMFWGFAFVPQKMAMAHLEPLSLIAARYLIGGLLIVPLALAEYRRRPGLTPRQWLLIGVLSLNFFFGSWLQQQGILITTVTNSGFLTGLYVFFVPFFMFLLFRNWPHPVVWLCAPLALFGLFLLNGATLDQINPGDLLIIVSAGFWGMHVLLLGYLSKETGLPIVISCVSFLVGGLLAVGGAVAMETPALADFADGWIYIAYLAVFSTAIGFTLQAIGQAHVPPANAAIILSAESLFAALAAAVLLGERLPVIGYSGAALIFLAIVAVETIPALQKRQART